MTLNPVAYKIAKPSHIRNFVTKLGKDGAILPVLLLEGTVTGGRTYQAYQRDGFVEARERVTEESLAAVFWLFGATMFGKLYSKLGEKFLKIPENMPDVGRDATRTPFNNFVSKISKSLHFTPEKRDALKNSLAKYSVGKTAASLITACLFIGYVIPKVNQGITKYIFGKMDKSDPNNTKGPDPAKTKLTIKEAKNKLLMFSAKDVSINAVENFKASRNENNKNSTKPSFKGADTWLRIVQNFETNDVWKLLGTDVGTVSGRTLNARNNDERVEIMFRDISSIYFYCFSVPHIVNFMNKKDSFAGMNTKLNPMSAMKVHNHLIDKMAEKGMDRVVNVQEFKEMALGKDLTESEKQVFEKFFSHRVKPAPKKQFFGLITKEQELPNRIMKLSEFEAKVDQFVQPEKRDSFKQMARKMADMLQPAKYFDETKTTEKIITESQVKDIFKGGAIREPEFMSDVLNNIFKKEDLFAKRKDTKPLTNAYRYISQSDIEAKRSEIIDYVKAIIKDAEKTGTVTAERMLELNKRNMIRNGLYMGTAMGVSALFLSTIIPKIQYYITFLRTGKNEFPGTEEIKK